MSSVVTSRWSRQTFLTLTFHSSKSQIQDARRGSYLLFASQRMKHTASFSSTTLSTQTQINLVGGFQRLHSHRNAWLNE